MNRSLIVFVGIALLGLYVIAFRGGGKGPTGDIAWIDDATTALSATSIGKRGKPTVINFTANWCPPCQMMKKQTWPDAGVARAMTSFDAVWADVDRHGAVAKRFGVESIPTIVLLDEGGKEIARRGGFMSPDELVLWLGR